MKDILVECFPLYRDKDMVFHGFDEETGKNVIGKYNRGKLNPKEPDLRLYYPGEDKEFLSLWLKESAKGIPYLIGNRNGCSYIGLIHFNKLSDEEPYLTVYFVLKTKECKN